MNVALFCHSIRSDWNHGNAHFLRGVATELQARGHVVDIYEPSDGWSAAHLAAEAGPTALDAYREAYPTLESQCYTSDDAGWEAVVAAAAKADVVLVHEWTDPRLAARIGRARVHGGGFVLLFHDTHHRSASRPDELAALDLSGYDGILAFGDVVRERYVRTGWARRAWTWHEAADTRVFVPRPRALAPADLIWIGNWGDGERSRELHEFVLEPARRLRLSGHVHGVRYPDDARHAVAHAGLEFAGRLPNHEVPAAYARHRVTVHVPRRPYVDALPGIPTIRVFEALACGIPLVSAPWRDTEGLFRAGRDYLVAEHGADVDAWVRALLLDPAFAASLSAQGRHTIETRHTCAHRVDELLAIVADLAPGPVSPDDRAPAAAAAPCAPGGAE